MPTGYPPRAECIACGLFNKCCNPWVHPRVDGRQHLEGQDLSQRPMVLFVLPHALMGDDIAERALHDERTTWMMNFLDAAPFRWAVTYLVRCWPGPDPKNRAKDRALLVANTRTCVQFLAEDYQRFQPSVVVSLGTEPLKMLWPADRGEAPSINKARTTPVKLANGTWLVSSFDPKQHFYYLTSDGRKGNDLTEEYLRVFRMVEQLLAGTYRNRGIEYSVITNQQEFELMFRRLKPNDECPLYIDTETTTWIMDSNEKKPWKWDLYCEERGLPYEPQKLTRWHLDSSLLVLGLTQYWPGGYHSFEILPHLLTSDIPGIINPNVDRLLRSRTIEFWNGKGDSQDIRIFCGGYNILDPEQHGNTWEDGMLRHGLRDMSLPGNGLKKVAVEHCGAEDWSIQMGQALSEAKHARVKRKEPALVHMGDVPIEITLPYNAGDHYWNAVVVEEHQLVPENQAVLDAIQCRYDMLIECYPWLAEMEWNGVPYRLDKLDACIQEYEAEVASIEATVRAQPEIIRAERRSGKSFNLNSPIFFEAMVAELMGHMDPNGVLQVPVDFPRTESGRLSQDKFVVAELAGERLSGAGVQIQFTTWEEKTPLQKFWSVLRRWKRTGDDLTKFRGLMDYVIPDPHDPTRGVIHTDFRVIRMETEEADSSDEDSGGAKSGRTSQTPNQQNIKKEKKFLELEEAPPGWLLLHLDVDRSELVWVGFNCNDQLYRQWAIEGLDAHLLNGANIFTFQTDRPIDDFWAYRSYEECMALDKCAPEQKPWRDIGKTDNFAVVFLKEPETIAAELKIPVEQAYAMFAASREAHQGVYHKLLEIYDRLQAGELIRTAWGGYRSGRGWQHSSMSAETFFSLDPEIRKKRNRLNMDVFRSVWNTAVGQGDSNDTVMHKGSRCWKRIRQGGWLDRDKLKPYNFVHDSTKWLVREGYETVAAPELRKEMMDMSTLPFAFDLPLGVSVEVGKNGAEMEKMKL